MRTKLTVAVAALAAITFTACDETPTATLAGGETATSGAKGAANANAPFPNFHQGFNHGVFPWIDGDDPGPSGWCGTVAHVDRRGGADLKPSAGRGYATVANGPCNDFWSGLGFESSAPASGPNFDLMSTTWPASGFVQELDVHLDPADYEEDGLAFIYTNSLCILTMGVDAGVCDPELPPAASPFRYFPVFVVRGGSSLLLLNSLASDAVPFTAITEPGWYTFRHVFGSDSGTLTVDFEITKDGRVLGSAPILETFISEQSTSDFEIADLGSGYIWFPVIAGPPLPIDEHRLRRGR